MASEVLIFRNPKAGRGAGAEKVDSLGRFLAADGFRVTILDSPANLRSEVLSRHEQGELRAVVVAGGDGTAELVASQTPPEVPLAVLPLGTENLLAKYLKVPSDPHAVASIVAANQQHRFDAGQANGRLFLLMASCGFDADVVCRLHEGRSGPIRHLSYAKPIVNAIWSYRYPPLRIQFEADAEQGGGGEMVDGPSEVYWVFVFNFPIYAAGLQIAPNASPQDGLLTVATFRGNSFWHGLYHFGAVALRSHQSLKGFQLFTTSRLHLSFPHLEEQVLVDHASHDNRSPHGIPYQIDGDPGGKLPVEICVLPQRLCLLVP